MWELYDTLIKSIPPDCRVDEAIPGEHWTMVRSGKGVGLAMTLHEDTRPNILSLPPGRPFCKGMPLAELAEAAKSWNFAEASLGMAAISAYWNSPEREFVAAALERGDTEAFGAWRGRVAGKRVAVIGHFLHLEKSLAPFCELSILERRPGPGDYPDSACEYLLPFQDFVFATGVTLINKTLPRLLELAGEAGIILAGPSVPMAPPLFGRGVRDLQGLLVTDPELCAAIVRGERPELTVFGAGRRVSVPGEGPPRAAAAGGEEAAFGAGGPEKPA
ncbi:MAG: DUF364 domain-containing protein [Treponema sp.]|nr:DUF364 domain-containing protein [Treponema sp.]